MSLEIVEVSSELVGKRLAQKLFNSKGSLLLGYGTEVSTFHNGRILEAGYRSVYVEGDDVQSVILDEPEHVISEKLRAKLPEELKLIFNQLLSNNKVSISDGKMKLNKFADCVVSAVEQSRLTEAPGLLDLKRQQDYAYQHAINVAAYSVLIGQRMRYHRMKLFDLAVGALVSDLGMLFLDRDVLNKPGELSEQEFEEVKKHTLLGFQHLGRKCFLKGLITIMAVQHHERIDGTGYPNGLGIDKIHEYSRIVAIADVFDAYTSDRPYRRLHTIKEALEHIRAESGKKFDPNIAEHFLAVFE